MTSTCLTAASICVAAAAAFAGLGRGGAQRSVPGIQWILRALLRNQVQPGGDQRWVSTRVGCCPPAVPLTRTHVHPPPPAACACRPPPADCCLPPSLQVRCDIRPHKGMHQSRPVAAGAGGGLVPLQLPEQLVSTGESDRQHGEGVAGSITNDCVVAATAPCRYSNKRWCCGDTNHMDISVWAFEKLASTSLGVMGIQVRRPVLPEAAHLGTPGPLGGAEPHALSQFFTHPSCSTEPCRATSDPSNQPLKSQTPRPGSIGKGSR